MSKTNILPPVVFAAVPGMGTVVSRRTARSFFASPRSAQAEFPVVSTKPAITRPAGTAYFLRNIRRLSATAALSLLIIVRSKPTVDPALGPHTRSATAADHGWGSAPTEPN